MLSVNRGGGNFSGSPVRMTIFSPFQWMKLLRESGLVSVRADGQRRLYRVEPAKLAELDAWLAPYRRYWRDKLDALENHLMRES